MTEKVVLTKEQAKAIEKFQKTVHELGISLDELKGIFESGYEVKPEFKVGDWVYDIQYNKVARIDHRGVDDNRVWVDDEDFNFYATENIRHATPSEIAEEKERRWWKEHGREPWELRKGDVLVDTDGEILEVTDKRDDSKGYYLDYCSYSLAMIKSRFIILTFAESRLDVKTND